MLVSLIEKPKGSFNGETMNRMSPARLTVVVTLLAVVAWLGWTGGQRNMFDTDTILRLTQFRADAPTLTMLAVALTWAGSAYVTLGGVLAASIWRWIDGDRAAAIWAFATVGGGRLLAEAVKAAVGRPRPHFTPWPVPVSSLSFPSGHATNSMLGFGVLALLLLPEGYRRVGSAVAVLLAILIGLTRPYLGVHWPSDVLAGWLLGGAVLLLAAPFRPGALPVAA